MATAEIYLVSLLDYVKYACGGLGVIAFIAFIFSMKDGRTRSAIIYFAIMVILALTAIFTPTSKEAVFLYAGHKIENAGEAVKDTVKDITE
jgi:tryptophan-rich sensory protein